MTPDKGRSGAWRAGLDQPLLQLCRWSETMRAEAPLPKARLTPLGLLFTGQVSTLSDGGTTGLLSRSTVGEGWHEDSGTADAEPEPRTQEAVSGAPASGGATGGTWAGRAGALQLPSTDQSALISAGGAVRRARWSRRER